MTGRRHSWIERPASIANAASATTARGVAPALLGLQRSAGNRAVAKLVARAPTTAEQRAAEKLREMAAAEHHSAAAEPHEPEWEEVGPLAKFMDEVVEMKLEEAHIPTHLAGLFAKAWDAYELYEFYETHDPEHLGGPVATAAGAAVKASNKAIETAEHTAAERAKELGLDEAATLAMKEAAIPRIAVAVRLAGGVVTVAWVAYEAFRLGQWIRQAFAERSFQEIKEHLSRTRWRAAMMQHVWSDYLGELKAERAEKFVDMANWSAGFGEVPPLSKSAAIRLMEIVNEASDYWLVGFEAWKENAKYLAEHAHDGPEDQPGFGETIHGAEMAQRRQAIGNIVKALSSHFGRIREFVLDPANWALTDRQKQVLGDAPMVVPQQASSAP